MTGKFCNFDIVILNCLLQDSQRHPPTYIRHMPGLTHQQPWRQLLPGHHLALCHHYPRFQRWPRCFLRRPHILRASAHHERIWPLWKERSWRDGKCSNQKCFWLKKNEVHRRLSIINCYEEMLWFSAFRMLLRGLKLPTEDKMTLKLKTLSYDFPSFVFLGFYLPLQLWVRMTPQPHPFGLSVVLPCRPLFGNVSRSVPESSSSWPTRTLLGKKLRNWHGRIMWLWK